MIPSAVPKSVSLLPREHGAYAQLGISLAVGVALVAGSVRAWGQVVAAGLVFLASEPLLVLLGRRGEGAKRLGAQGARRRLGIYALVLLPALVLAWGGATVREVLSVVPALAFGLGLLALFLIQREHSTLGELSAAAAFASSSLPVAVLGELPTRKTLVLVLGLAALNGLGTILVRCYLASQRRERSWVRIIPVLLGAALTAAAWVWGLPRILAFVPLPLTMAALWVLVAPPAPRHLRRVGWLLASGTALGALGLLG